MSKTKRNYEIYLIVDGNFDDSVIDEIIGKYENWMKKNHVEIKNTDRIGRRRLAYQIRRKLNGYYICFEIMAPTETVTKLERNFKLDENIMRYLCVFMSKRELNEKDQYMKKRAAYIAKIEAEAKEKAAQKNEENAESVNAGNKKSIQ